MNAPPSTTQQQPTRDEQIGYHKGCLNTLVAERNELLKIAQITEALMQAHLAELQKLGVHINPPQGEQHQQRKK